MYRHTKRVSIFWKIRDSRTLFSIMPTDPRKEIEFEAHNALKIAKYRHYVNQITIGKLKLKLK